MADGFLGRWARRKHQALQGEPLDEPKRPLAAAAAQPTEATGVAPVPATAMPERSGDVAAPLPSLDDVKHLTTQSDFAPFMTHGVAPEVKNAAMKKLFADPHFNVMDRLDIYIDDYSKPDPLPLAMLRQMSSAKFLNLFDEDKEKPDSEPVRDNANLIAPGSAGDAETAAPTPPGPSAASPAAPCPSTMETHADTDLRLQQDHAAGAPGSGRST